MTSRPRRLRFRAATFRVVVCGVLGLAASVANARAQSADDLFNPAVMQRIDIGMNSQDWEKLKQNFQENTYYPADIAWNGQTARNSGIRSRGLGSRSGTKPGLRVDFDRYSTDQTFLGLKSIVLDNLTQDASGVKESVAMRMFARMGVPAPRESFARVFVNEPADRAVRRGRVGGQGSAGARVRIDRRQRAERRLSLRIQLHPRLALALRLPGRGPRRLLAALRRQDAREQERQ